MYRIIILTLILLNINLNAETCPTRVITEDDNRHKCFTLRVGENTYFGNYATNGRSYKVKFKDSKVTFKPQNGFKYNGEKDNPIFNWSNWIRNRKGILQSYQRGLIIKATSNYKIKYRPKIRSYKNLEIIYETKYINFKDEKEHGSIKTDKVIAHYEISWCGDGVLDHEYNEKCDPKDPKYENFGNLGCTMTCLPISKK